MVHGRLATECPDWAGWVFIEEDEFKVSKLVGSYWYNPATGQEQIKMPEMQKEWEVRLMRSQFQGEKHGLENYFDPMTSAYFQRHVLSNTFM
jgi:hypothetical protein